MEEETSALKGREYGREPFLRDQINKILNFYAPRCYDEKGGFHNQLLDDGTVFDASTKHVVGTCRYVVNFCLAFKLFGGARNKELAAHGIDFLMTRHMDSEHGGLAWVLDMESGTFSDDNKYCYAHAFAFLALAEGCKIGIPGCADHIKTLFAVVEERFYEPQHRLYRDQVRGSRGHSLPSQLTAAPRAVDA
jgi:mannose/cellobiose epimerase-like protein (N-acyl-D-glucosamine 2-epimerase family)